MRTNRETDVTKVIGAYMYSELFVANSYLVWWTNKSGKKRQKLSIHGAEMSLNKTWLYA